METRASGVDLSSLARPLRALIDRQQAALEALHAENAALSDIATGVKLRDWGVQFWVSRSLGIFADRRQKS